MKRNLDEKYFYCRLNNIRKWFSLKGLKAKRELFVFLKWAFLFSFLLFSSFSLSIGNPGKSEYLKQQEPDRFHWLKDSSFSNYLNKESPHLYNFTEDSQTENKNHPDFKIYNRTKNFKFFTKNPAISSCESSMRIK